VSIQLAIESHMRSVLFWCSFNKN